MKMKIVDWFSLLYKPNFFVHTLVSVYQEHLQKELMAAVHSFASI